MVTRLQGNGQTEKRVLKKALDLRETEYEVTVNDDVALANGNWHNERVAVSDTEMLLRERIKRLMGNGIHVSWKSLPDVKSSRLLETLTEKQIELEELKFCLITCEVVFNTELVDLLDLSKQSVSWTDPLPKFNRRTIATTVERVKHCSDRFLDAFEKHWNVRPTVSLLILCKILRDLSPQFQNYITYCTHQEELRTVLRTAMSSKHKVVAASFSDKLNLERVMLPIQHLKLSCLLLKNIHSLLINTTNYLDNFHCNRILAGITKLLGECYRLLAKLHGSLYVENIDRLLDESVRGFEQEQRRNTISKCNKSVSVDPKILCGKEATDSVDDVDSTTLGASTLLHVSKCRSPSVKEQCKYFDLQTVEKNCRDILKRSDRCNTVERQDFIQVCGKRAINYTLKHRSSQFIIRRCAMFEGRESHDSLFKRQNCCTRLKYSAFQFANAIGSTTVKDRKRNLSMYETLNTSEGSNGSKKHTGCLKDELNISVDNNKKPSYITCSSDDNDGGGDSGGDDNNNNNNNNKPPKSTSVISTDSCLLSVSQLSRNLTKLGIESFCAKDVIRESCLNDSGKVEKYEISNKLQSFIVQKASVPSLVLQNNHCQEVLEQCSAITQSGSKLNTPTSAVPSPPKVQHNTIKFHSSGDNFHADQLQTENRSCISEVTIEVQCTPQNEEEKCSDLVSSLSNQLYNGGSPSSDGLSSITKDTSYTEELSTDTLRATEQSPKTEKHIFISYCDFHCNSTAQLPSQEESVEIDELSNDYKLMNESFRRKSYQFKPVTPCELTNKNTNGADDCGCEYEECKPHDTDDTNSGKNNRLLPAYDVPLYQVYNFQSVEHSKTEVEDNIYIEPDENIYEEIIYSECQPESNVKEVAVHVLDISEPAGTHQQLRWVNTAEVANSGLLAEMDTKEVALQEAKYEFISSEYSYYKSLLILETVFIRSEELTDTAVLQAEDHMTLFSCVGKAKECSEKFLGVLLEGWPQDLKLNYLCHVISKFVLSGSFQTYVDCCGSHIFIYKTLQHLMLTNSKFNNALSKLQADPICQMFSLQTFLSLPLQRVTKLPLLVQAIIKRLPPDHVEHSVWTDTLVQLQKIAEKCNEAAGRAEVLAVECFNHHVLQQDIKGTGLNLNHLLQRRRKKQAGVWRIFGRGRQKPV